MVWSSRINMIKQFIINLFKSLNNKQEGLSFRKLVSILMLFLVVYIHIRYVDTTNCLTALEYDLIFVCALLGLINLDKIVDLKYGNKESESDKSDQGKV